MSEAYTSFAAVYDIFMDETPYAEWCEYLAELLNEYGMIQLRKMKIFERKLIAF